MIRLTLYLLTWDLLVSAPALVVLMGARTAQPLADLIAGSQLGVCGSPMASYSSVSPDGYCSGFCCGLLRAVVFPK